MPQERAGQKRTFLKSCWSLTRILNHTTACPSSSRKEERPQRVNRSHSHGQAPGSGGLRADLSPREPCTALPVPTPAPETLSRQLARPPPVCVEVVTVPSLPRRRPGDTCPSASTSCQFLSIQVYSMNFILVKNHRVGVKWGRGREDNGGLQEVRARCLSCGGGFAEGHPSPGYQILRRE